LWVQNPSPCLQFFNPRLRKNQQGTLSQGSSNLQYPWRNSDKYVELALNIAWVYTAPGFYYHYAQMIVLFMLLHLPTIMSTDKDLVSSPLRGKSLNPEFALISHLASWLFWKKLNKLSASYSAKLFTSQWSGGGVLKFCIGIC